MNKKKIAILLTIYGAVSALCLVGLYCVTLLEGGEANCLLCLDNYVFEPSVLIPFLMINACIVSLIHFAKFTGDDYFEPLFTTQKIIFIAKTIYRLSFIFLLLNFFYGFFMQLLNSSGENVVEKGYFAIPIFYSFMIFFSLSISFSFLVGLCNIVPKWVVSLYDHH